MWACPSLRSGRHLTGFASLMASPPLRGPPGGSRKNKAIQPTLTPLAFYFTRHFPQQFSKSAFIEKRKRLKNYRLTTWPSVGSYPILSPIGATFLPSKRSCLRHLIGFFIGISTKGSCLRHLVYRFIENASKRTLFEAKFQ